MSAEALPQDRIPMSPRDRDVLKVMAPVLAGRRTQAEAARLLGRSVRQVRRLQRRLEAEGDAAVVHRLRGRPSNHRLDPALRRRAVAAYRADFADFGPTLAREKLAERGLVVGLETLRRWLIQEGLWQPRASRDPHRRRRPRRRCFGELVQMDTSLHDWTEGRGEPMVLVAMIDDATNRLEAGFYDAETVVSHFDLLGRWLGRHGRPHALYTDRDSIFVHPTKGRPDPEALTQFGRALLELDIGLILAHSPQAKGRIERFFELAQDRWVKELRLAGVRTRAEANALARRLLVPQYNRRFTVRPASPNDAHRPLLPGHHLAAILSVQHARGVANDYTVRFENRCYQLLPPAWPGQRGGKVVLELRLDGTLAIRFGARYLKYEEVVAREEALGAPPPDPRSLPPPRPTPVGKKSGRAPAEEARPAGVQPAGGRSGRTPAEPYPPAGAAEDTKKGPYRPPANHPWRRTFLKRKKEDSSTGG
jgi:transposase